MVGRNEAGPDGFLVPHSDPPHRPELIERYSYGWCNGPAGDAQVFRLLAGITGDQMWTALGDRCWNTIRHSGLPSRIRPGFWDNNGRCCGTADVLALACDRIVERGDDFGFADTLASSESFYGTPGSAKAAHPSMRSPGPTTQSRITLIERPHQVCDPGQTKTPCNVRASVQVLAASPLVGYVCC